MGAIVIAEDDPDIRSLIAAKLSDSGHRVTATGDGVAALVAVRRERPDAVVLDMQMPGMSGLDVVRMLRVDPATADVPVIMVTSHDAAPYVGESFLSGADDFLAKPFSPRELTARVAQLLENGRGSATPIEGPVSRSAAARPGVVRSAADPSPAVARPASRSAVARSAADPSAAAGPEKPVGRRGFFSMLSRTAR
jgi:DNA-binding response OmpR family regulator